MLIAVTLRFADYHCVVCCYSEFCSAQCRYAECHFADCYRVK